MREIKFRLIKSGKIVGYEQHVLITYRNKPKEIGIFHSTHGDPRELGVYNILVHPDKFIDHDHKEQYTSLDDKNGKEEIYAADIIEAIDPIVLERGGDYEYIGLVSWSTKSLAWILTNKDGEFSELLCRVEQPKIIGNIHQNPELLK